MGGLQRSPETLSMDAKLAIGLITTLVWLFACFGLPKAVYDDAKSDAERILIFRISRVAAPITAAFYPVIYFLELPIFAYLMLSVPVTAFYYFRRKLAEIALVEKTDNDSSDQANGEQGVAPNP